MKLQFKTVSILTILLIGCIGIIISCSSDGGGGVKISKEISSSSSSEEVTTSSSSTESTNASSSSEETTVSSSSEETVGTSSSSLEESQSSSSVIVENSSSSVGTQAGVSSSSLKTEAPSTVFCFFEDDGIKYSCFKFTNSCGEEKPLKDAGFTCQKEEPSNCDEISESKENNDICHYYEEAPKDGFCVLESDEMKYCFKFTNACEAEKACSIGSGIWQKEEPTNCDETIESEGKDDMCRTYVFDDQESGYCIIGEDCIELNARKAKEACELNGVGTWSITKPDNCDDSMILKKSLKRAKK